MDITIPPILLYIAAWFGTMSGIWALFERAEIVLSKDTKDKLVHWLTTRQDKELSIDLAMIISQSFDSVFGGRTFSLRRLLTSIAATYLTGGILLVLYIVGEELGFWDYNFDIDTQEFFEAMLILNVLPDLFSLIQTRRILGLMDGKKLRFQTLLLIADVILTSLISIFTFSFFTWFADGEGTFQSFILDMFDLWNDSLMIKNSHNSSDIILTICVYTTFLTSIWIWLFYLGISVIRTLNTSRTLVIRSLNVFDIEEKPLRSIGFIGMVVVTLIFFLIPFV